jgi:hypothetical protein
MLGTEPGRYWDSEPLGNIRSRMWLFVVEPQGLQTPPRRRPVQDRLSWCNALDARDSPRSSAIDSA